MNCEDIFSIRIVVADHYMWRPVSGLDPCYSEFRGYEIKSVPIIRIFGSNGSGEKTCLHVHGVFPYFYVPYESTDIGSIDKVIYQIASAVDKAVNISLGQANSRQQHVFKIQLVKGIPFYGYHQKEHQFLKIFLYNPRFVRRVANLFQNGAILGKIFQPHESHVPYILQFFIDYNLYGMSFLHVPREIVKFRPYQNGEEPSDINTNQMLDNVSRMSASRHEVDVAATFILNRFQLVSKSSAHTNPGIASIWQDERIRREKLLHENDEIPPLDVPSSQERVGITPTESDIFYQTVLKKKIFDFESNLDQSLNLTADVSSTEKKSKFNLSKLLLNSIYPQECSQEERLTDASVIQDHYSNQSLFHLSAKKLQSETSLSTSTIDDSIVDEELIMNLSQNKLSQTLHEQDFDLLEVMKQLEEGDEDILEIMQKLEEGEQEIDLDSTLAPLSQTHKLTPILKKSEDENKAICLDNDLSDSDEDVNDFTLVVDDIDRVLAKLSQTNPVNEIESIPQMDGADDILCTPKKRMRKNGEKLSSAQKTPKTPTRRPCRYTPLQITKKSPKANRRRINGRNQEKSDDVIIIEDVDEKIIRDNNEIIIKNDDDDVINLTFIEEEQLDIRRSSRRSKRTTQNRVSSINGFAKNCSLENGLKRNLETCNVRYNKRSVEKKEKDMTLEEHQEQPSSNTKHAFSTENVNVPPLKKCKVELKKLNLEETMLPSKRSKTKEKRCRSPSDVAREYDRRNNFFPEPGPSHINYYELIDVPNPELPKRKDTTPVKELTNCGSPKSFKSSESDREDGLNVCSFYDKSFIVDSPSMFSDSSPASSKKYSLKIKSACSASSNSLGVSNLTGLIITPLDLPPTFEEVSNNLVKFQIPEVTYVQPFYSNRADVTQRKEVGSTVLKISSNSLNDCEEFQSVLTDLDGIYAKRRKIILSMGDWNLLDQFKTNNEIKEYFCNQHEVIISTRDLPPSKHDAKIWLKARELLHEPNTIKEDSPIKVRREKAKLTLENDFLSNDELETSQKSLSLSPLSPLSNNNDTKETNNNDDSLLHCTPKHLNSTNQRAQKPRACLSLSRRLNKMHTSKESRRLQSPHLDKSEGIIIKCIPPENLLQDNSSKEYLSQHTQTSTQSNDSVNSDLVIAALQRSSFRKNLNVEGDRSSNDGSFGISGATLDNTFGFKVNLENLQNAKADVEFDYLSIMSLEIFVPSREDLKPNPEYDPIIGLFYSIVNNVPEKSHIPQKFSGCILVTEEKSVNFLGIDAKITKVKSEDELLKEFLNLCQFWDPDIFVGYEVEMGSWGYVMDRCRFLNMNFISHLSRIPSQKVRDVVDEDKDQFTDLDLEMKLCGRILLDVWRLMRSEIALTSYTFENVMYHIMHRRCPMHSYRNLTKWFSSLTTRWIVVEYYFERVNGTLELLEQLDLIGRTSEMAKLIGIQFYEVLSRGSQFRVESMMLRIAKPKNLVPLSPSVQQRAHMRAPEYLPLILEPQSRFYVDPLIVLDFQSLYPSMIIAYNYCFSTCLGRVEHLGGKTPFEFGASQLRISPKLLKNLVNRNAVTVSPCGAVFVKAGIRQGILPRMLQEILDTRLMVKQSMKIHKSNTVLQRVLHSRQLGLKLMANVTYGYTAANFSGRMPCVEVGDSVVSKGRETLERAIKLVETNDKWRVKVVYGDTDSLFVLVPGRTRAEAFEIGEEIAEAVTNDNPQPVKLKLEKVYQPSILQTKKRYVGFMYETADQKEPVYEAKGIETVRRDGCPAVAKMLEKCLRILFETRDVSKVKKYVCRQFTKLLSGRANVQDLIFAKEFRGKNGYKPGACVPALELTKKWLQIDPRNEPRRGERVPFVIINGPPGVPLIRLVRSPHEYLADEGMKINAIYYITKAIIPPLNRCLLLIGADVNEWFADLPRKNFFMLKLSTASEVISNNNNNTKKSTISQYFSSTNCVIDCGRQTKSGICTECMKNSRKCVVVLSKKIAKLERGFFLTKKICESCCRRQYDTECHSLDCPVLFVQEIKRREQKQTEHFRNLLADNF